MSPPAPPRLLFLFLFTLLTVPATHTFPLTNLSIPFGPTTISLNRTASSFLAQPIIHQIPNTNPPLILYIEPVPYATRLDSASLSLFLRGAIHWQQRAMTLAHLTRSSPYPGRFEYGKTIAFTLQACEMEEHHAPKQWHFGDLLDVMAGVSDVADQIKWESGVTVYRELGFGAFEELADGAVYKDQPRVIGGAMAASKGLGDGRCAAGRGDEGASRGGNAPQLTG